MDDLPEKMFECEGEVIVTHEDCALVLIKDVNHICYVSSDVFSRNLKVGDIVMLNARIAPKECVHPEIPYLCRALWDIKERVPSHLFPRMLERFQVEELEDYIRWASTLQERIPSEFDKFMQKEDISALGGLLAMQGIIDDAPLRKKPEKEPTPEPKVGTGERNGKHEYGASDVSDHDTDHHKKKKKRKKKKKKRYSAASESDIEIVEEKMHTNKEKSVPYEEKRPEQEEDREGKKDRKKKKRKKEESSAASEVEIEEEEISKKKKKKDKKKKEKKSKKKKKRKHSSSEESDLEIAKVVKKKHKIDVDIENIPHHLVLHKLNDMMHELEKGIDPEQLHELLEKGKPAGNKAKGETAAIAYPKIGEAYDPKAINTWSNMRGFQSVAATKSSWLGLTVAPGAQPSVIPELKMSFGKEIDENVPVAVAEVANDDPNDGDENSSSSSSKDSSPKKDSMFKNIFGDEREPSPENKEDEIMEKAFKRKEKPDANQTPKPKSNNLAMALQSRLKQASSANNHAQKDDKQLMDRQSLERPYYKPHHNQQTNTYDKQRQRYNHHHNKDNNKRSRSRSQSYQNDRYNKQKINHDRNNRFSVEERYNKADRFDSKGDRYDSKGDRFDRSGVDDNSRRPSMTDSRRQSMTDSRQSSERSRYESKGSRQSSERSRNDTKASSRHRSRNKSRSRDSSSGSDSSRSSTRKKLTGSVSRDKSSPSDSDSDNNSKRRNLKNKSKLKKIKEEKSKTKKKKKTTSGGVKMNYSDEDKADSSSSDDSDAPSHNVDDSKFEIESDPEDDEKMIERIRKQRARLMATLPSADRELQIQQEVDSSMNKNGGSKTRGGIPITSFTQDPETKNEEELKEFKTVLLSGSVLSDGDFSQVFQISATVQGQEKSYYQCSFPEVLKKSNSLNLGSKNQLMETLQLKSSKFDVCREGLLNVYYKHPKNSSTKTVTEKDLLLGLLIFLQGLDEPVVLFVHNKDSLLPALIAKMNHYKLFDHFLTIVVCCCDLATLSWNLRLDTVADAKEYPSLRTIAENVNQGKVVEVDQENASSVLGTTLDLIMKNHKLSMQRVIEISNKISLVDYMNYKINTIQAMREELEDEKPEYIEISHSHQAYGDSNRVQLVWNTMENIKKMLKGSRSSEKRSTPSRDHKHSEEQVKSPAVVKSRFTSTEDWETKTYNCFLAPGNFTIKGKQSLAVELRVPALQLRLTELRGKSALVEKHQDFSLCHLESSQSSIQQSAHSLFPIVSVTLRNSVDEALTINSKEISGPLATVRLAVK